MSPIAGAFTIKPPIVAYVTFHTVAGRHSCLNAYPPGWLNHVLMSPGKVLRNCKLMVQPAPAPASLAWENIGTPSRWVAFMEALHTLGLLFLLIIPYAVIFIGRKFTFSGYLHGEGEELLNGRALPSCAVKPAVGTLDVASVHCVCSWQSWAQSSTLACYGWFVATSIEALGPVMVGSHECRLRWSSYSSVWFFSGFFIVQVVFVNMALGYILRRLSQREGHYSSEGLLLKGAFKCPVVFHFSNRSCDIVLGTRRCSRAVHIQTIDGSTIFEHIIGHSAGKQ